ncbi:MAG: Crp/Fnr family transcriptional regulator [Balneolaceae bacterium]|nr:Crp/Fnr family transcriptional regulator [Balneolaceae bacterium]
MENRELKTLAERTFPEWSRTDWFEEIIAKNSLLKVPSGETLLKMNSWDRVVPLVLQGAIKVLRVDDEGRELYLYHITAGESCAMTLKSILTNEKNRVKAVTVEDTTFLAIPEKQVRTWYRSDKKFMNFVFSTFQQRFEELLNTLDQVAFQRVDRRLISLLQERAEATGRDSIRITHQELADELNSSREVVSRLLKQLEKKGMVQLGRNQIEILDLL